MAGTVLPPAVQGAFWMLFSGVCYVISVTILRHLGGAYSAFEITFIRSIVAVVMLAPMFFRARPGSLWPARPKTIALATVLVYLGIWLWMTSGSLLPVADFFAIQFATPLTAIISEMLGTP